MLLVIEVLMHCVSLLPQWRTLAVGDRNLISTLKISTSSLIPACTWRAELRNAVPVQEELTPAIRSPLCWTGWADQVGWGVCEVRLQLPCSSGTTHAAHPTETCLLKLALFVCFYVDCMGEKKKATLIIFNCSCKRSITHTSNNSNSV